MRDFRSPSRKNGPGSREPRPFFGSAYVENEVSQLPRGFKEEPGAAFGLVDPDLNQASGGVVASLAGDLVGGSQAFNQGPVVGVKFEEHVAGGHKFLIVVDDALQLGNVTDGADGRAPDFANALGDIVGDFEDLSGLFIE